MLILLTPTSKMMKIKMLITFCWVANALVYTTIAYNTENIGDNLLITWTLTAAVEAPATISNLFVLNRYGRVLPMVSGMIVAGNSDRGTFLIKLCQFILQTHFYISRISIGEV